MESEKLEEELLRFFDQYIDTVPHLEALLLLWYSPCNSAWSVEQLAARIYVAPSTAKGILEDLMRHGMIRAQDPEGSPASYALDPQWDARHRILGRVAHAYSRQLTRVAALIHSKGPRSGRSFTRAVKLEKDQ